MNFPKDQSIRSHFFAIQNWYPYLQVGPWGPKEKMLGKTCWRRTYNNCHFIKRYLETFNNNRPPVVD